MTLGPSRIRYDVVRVERPLFSLRLVCGKVPVFEASMVIDGEGPATIEGEGRVECTIEAPRLTPGPSAPAELARLLASAQAGGRAWDCRRRAARAAYEENHRPADVAQSVVNFLETI